MSAKHTKADTIDTSMMSACDPGCVKTPGDCSNSNFGDFDRNQKSEINEINEIKYLGKERGGKSRAYNDRSPGFGLLDLVIIYQQNGRPEEAKQTEKRLLSARPQFTITAWRNTQFRCDQVRLEADIAALCAAGLPME